MDVNMNTQEKEECILTIDQCNSAMKDKFFDANTSWIQLRCRRWPPTDINKTATSIFL